MHMNSHENNGAPTRPDFIDSGLWVNVAGIPVSFSLAAHSERREKDLSAGGGKKSAIILVWGEKYSVSTKNAVFPKVQLFIIGYSSKIPTKSHYSYF